MELRDPEKIAQIEAILQPTSDSADRKKLLNQLSGAWSNEEADQIKAVIADGCENVDRSEW